MKPFALFVILYPSLLLLSCQSEKSSSPSPENKQQSPVTMPEASITTKSFQPTKIVTGNLEFSPAQQYRKAKVGTIEVEYEFKALNIGLDPITITSVDSGCACIAESVEPRVIKPGQTSTITAIYNTEKVKGIAEKMLIIGTDQAGVKDTFLKVKLEMESIYTIDQQLTTWKKGKKNETKVVTFEVTRPELIHVLEVNSSRSEIKAELEEVEKGKIYRIHITPDSTGANLLGMVRIITDCEIEAHARPLLYVTIQ